MSQALDLLTGRWSPRAFAPRAIDAADLATLFEAARWAPSCYNGQPWHFVLARRGDAAHEALFPTLMGANQAWAATAPLLVLNVVNKNFSHNGKPNGWSWYDLGLAVGNLLAQATHLGILAHQMAGFDAQQAHARLGLPADCDAVAVMALGYLGDPATLPSGVEEKSRDARERKPLPTFVHDGAWGKAFTA